MRPSRRGARESPRREPVTPALREQSADESAPPPVSSRRATCRELRPAALRADPGPAAEPAAPISGPILIVRPADGDSTEASSSAGPRPRARRGPVAAAHRGAAAGPQEAQRSWYTAGGGAGAAGPWSRPGASFVPNEPVQRLGAPPGMLAAPSRCPRGGFRRRRRGASRPRPSRCRPSRAPARTTTGAPPSTTRRASRARRAGSPPTATTPTTPTTTPTTPTTPTTRPPPGDPVDGARADGGYRRRAVRGSVHRRRGRGHRGRGHPGCRHCRGPRDRGRGQARPNTAPPRTARRTPAPPNTAPPRAAPPRTARALRGDHHHPAGGRRPDGPRRRAAARPARGDPRAAGVGGRPDRRAPRRDPAQHPGRRHGAAGAGQHPRPVVLSERKGIARPVRTIKEVQEGTAVGELLRRDLIRSQLMVTLRFGALAVLVLGTLPAILTLLPAVGQLHVAGLRVPWLLLGVLVYPFLIAVGWRTSASPSATSRTSPTTCRTERAVEHLRDRRAVAIALRQRGLGGHRVASGCASPRTTSDFLVASRTRRPALERRRDLAASTCRRRRSSASPG